MTSVSLLFIYKMPGLLLRICIYVIMVKGINAATYTFYSTSKSWTEALDACWYYGKQLAIADSQGASNTMTSVQSNTDYWIGLSDGHTEGVWRWVNGKAASWANWKDGHPSSGTSKNCALYKSGSPETWEAESCSSSKPYMCQDETEHDTCAGNIVTNGQGPNKECLGYRNAIMESSTLCHTSSDAVSYLTNTEEECRNWCYLRPDIITTSCSYVTNGNGRCKMSDDDSALNTECQSTTSSTRRYADSSTETCATATKSQGAQNTASSQCMQPIVRNAEDETKLRNFMVAQGIYQLWIGLRYDIDTGSWKWPDGSYPEGYHNWKDGEPNDNSGQCAYLDRNDGTWRQNGCTAGYNYVCGLTLESKCPNLAVPGASRTYDSTESLVLYSCHEGSTFSDGTTEKRISCDCHTDSATFTSEVQALGSCNRPGSNDNCDTPIFEHTGLCYWWVDDTVSWQDAWTGCYDNGGRLAMMQDEATYNFFTSEMQREGWIGMTDGVSEGTFRWSNSQASDPLFENFEYGPTRDNNECVYTTNYAKWTVDSCDLLKPYICQSYHESLPIYQCDNLQDGCLGLWPDTWKEADICLDTTISLFPGRISKYTSGVASLDQCKKLCQMQINFRCRTIQYASMMCTVMEVEQEDILDSVKIPCSANRLLLYRTPLARDEEVCYTIHSNVERTPGESKTYCESNGKQLYKVTNEREQLKLKAFGKDVFSTVYRYTSEDGTISYQYRYFDGTYPEYMPWQSDEPKYDNSKTCVKSQGGDKLAEGDSCTSTKHDTICESNYSSHCASLVPTDSNADMTTTFNSSTNSYTTVYACHPGYYFPTTQKTKQSFTCTCNDGQNTVVMAGTCEIVDCQSLPSVQDAVWVSGTSTVFNSTVHYRCNTGYLPQTLQALRCQEDASWTELPDTCIVVDCQILPSVQDAVWVSGTSTVFNSTVHYRCNTGYLPQTLQALTCQDDASWTELPDTCIVVDCQSLPSVQDAVWVSGSSTVFNSTVHYRCNTGYLPQTLQALRCQDDASWTELPDTCIGVDCGTPPAITNASVVFSEGTLYNDTKIFRCNEGSMFARGDITRTVICGGNGTWDSTTDVCVDIACGQPPIATANMTVITGNNTGQNDNYNSTITYQCDYGYKFDNNNKTNITLTCGIKGLWDAFNSSCVKVDCGPAPNVANASINFINNSTLYRDSVSFTCIRKKMFSRGVISKTTVCRGDATWNMADEVCIDLDCGDLPILENGYILNDTTTINSTLGSKAYYSCHDGYRFHDNSTTTLTRCIYKAFWRDFSSNCVRVDCGPIPAIQNGSIQSSEGTKFNDTAILECNPGKEFSSGVTVKRLTCTSSGNWTDPSPMCVDAPATTTAPATTSADGVTVTTADTIGTTDAVNVTAGDTNGTTDAINVTTGGTIGTTDAVTVTTGDTTGTTDAINVTTGATTGTTDAVTVTTGDTTGTTDAINVTTGGTTRTTDAVTVTTGGTIGTTDSVIVTTGNTIGTTDAVTVTTGDTIGTTDAVTVTTDGITDGITTDGITATTGSIIVSTNEPNDGNSDVSTIEETGNTEKDTTTIGVTSVEEEQTTIFPGLRCSDPPILRDTGVTESFPFVNAYAVYQCKQGFEFADYSLTRTIECRPGAIWHTGVNNCEAKHCEDIVSSIENAECDSQDTQVSVLITCVCEGDLRFSNGQSTAQVTCTNAKEWHIHPGSCMARCPELPLVRNSQAVWEGVNEPGGSVLIQCDEGHRFADGESEKWMACEDDLEWEDIGYCLIDTCPAIPQEPHRYVNTSQAVFGTVVEVTCEEGYTFYPGYWIIFTECQALGIWNMTDIPLCVEVSCEVVTTIPNALAIGNGTDFGTSVMYPCISTQNAGIEENYRHTDGYTSKTIFCQQNSQWSDTQLSCELGRCDPVPIVSNAVPDNTLATARNVVTYTCNPGYIFPGQVFQQTIQCINGQWNITHLACQILLCPEAPVISHANPNTTDIVYDTHIEYLCDEGYLFYDHDINNNSLILWCAESQRWLLMNVENSQEVPTTCSLLKCGRLPNIEFGQTPVEYADTYGTSITVNCRSGYWVGRGIFTQKLTCSVFGEWEPSPRRCKEVKCPALASWTGVQVNNTNRNIGAVISATCKPNSENQTRVFTDRSSIKEAKCSSDGEWIPIIPDCIDLVPPPVFQPAPTEAQNAVRVGIIGATLVSITFILILLADVPFFISELVKLQKLIFECRNKK